jgi:hypothetical protein
MYLVVSQWEAIPGHEEQMEKIGHSMRELLAAQKGVDLLKTFQAEDGKTVVILGYADRATYDNIINNPDGPFIRGLQEYHLEDHARWISSQRGEAID